MPFTEINEPGWERWVFEDGVLIDYAGNRYTPFTVQACLFLRQMDAFRVLRPLQSNIHSAANDAHYERDARIEDESLLSPQPVRLRSEPIECTDDGDSRGP